jgi:hypothetical protein
MDFNGSFLMRLKHHHVTLLCNLLPRNVGLHPTLDRQMGGRGTPLRPPSAP